MHGTKNNLQKQVNLKKTQAMCGNCYATLAFYYRPFASYAAEISASSTPQPASLLYMNAKATSYIYSTEYTFA